MTLDPLAAAAPDSGRPHAPSYWAATAGPPPAVSSEFTGEQSADVAVIGGGYTGLSAALHLAQGGASVALLEANEIGWGCSGRNGGVVSPSVGRLTAEARHRRFGAAGAARLEEEGAAAVALVNALIEKHGIDCDVCREGRVQLAHKAAHEKALRRSVAVWMDAETVQRRFFRGRGVGGGAFIKDGFGVHALKLAHGVARAAQAAGARLYCRQPALSVQQAGGKCVITTPAARLTADQVIVATNGYGGEKFLPPLAGRALPVLSSIIVTRPMTAAEKEAANFHSHAVFYDTRFLRRYYRKLPDDRILMGGRGAVLASKTALARRYVALLQALKQLLPPLSSITADYAWSGWVNVTWDQLPHIIRLPGLPQTIVAMGYNGTGVSYGLLAGKRAAAMAAGGGDAAADIPPMVNTMLPRFPLAPFRRLGQRLIFGWRGIVDEWGRLP